MNSAYDGFFGSLKSIPMVTIITLKDERLQFSKETRISAKSNFYFLRKTRYTRIQNDAKAFGILRVCL